MAKIAGTAASNTILNSFETQHTRVKTTAAVCPLSSKRAATSDRERRTTPPKLPSTPAPVSDPQHHQHHQQEQRAPRHRGRESTLFPHRYQDDKITRRFESLKNKFLTRIVTMLHRLKNMHAEDACVPYPPLDAQSTRWERDSTSPISVRK